MITIHNQKFGVEIEFFGIDKDTAIEIANGVIGGRIVQRKIIDSKGRVWRMKSDCTVNGEGNEFVTPPITFEDVPTLVAIVDKWVEAGAKTDSSCGGHIHVDGSNHNLQSLKNLIKYFAKYEDMFYTACGVLPNRVGWAAKISEYANGAMGQAVEKAQTMEEFKQIWVLGKFNGLNISSMWYTGTIEFRLFNGTVDSEQLVANIILALSISAKAINSKTVNSRKNQIVPDKFLFPKILGGLGMASKDPITGKAYKLFTKIMKQAS